MRESQSTLRTQETSGELSKTAWPVLASAVRKLEEISINSDGGGSVYNYAALVYRSEIGRPLVFDNVPWLAEIYADNNPDQTSQKCSQAGFTTYAFNRLAALAEAGVPGIYVLPDDGFRSDFMREKFHPVMGNNPAWRSNLGGAYKSADAMSVKHLFGTPWKFVGARNRKNFYSFTAGAAIIDEFDLCNQSNLSYLEDRFGRQDKVFVYRLGNPSLPGLGINAAYNASDAKIWMIKCPACNDWQALDWFENVVRQVDEGEFELRDPDWPASTDPGEIDFDQATDARIYCRKCHKPIDRLARGFWVKTYENRIRSGYAINKIFADVRARACILELFFGRTGFLESRGDLNLLQRFYNNVLGIPFRPPGSAISEELLDRCIAGDEDPWERYHVPEAPLLDEHKKPIETVGGLDINPAYGHVLHVDQVDFDGYRRKLATLRASSWEEVQELKDLWNVQTGVVDMNPEREPARRFVEDNPGWYTCEFVTSKISGPFKVDHRDQHIKADKTVTLDRAFRDFQVRQVLLPADYRSLHADFVGQMTSSVRRLKEVQGKLLTKVVAVWDEGNARDDDRLADAYAKMAAAIFTGEPILEAA